MNCFLMQRNFNPPRGGGEEQELGSRFLLSATRHKPQQA
jgi:hypothetical protein